MLDTMTLPDRLRKEATEAASLYQELHREYDMEDLGALVTTAKEAADEIERLEDKVHRSNVLAWFFARS